MATQELNFFEKVYQIVEKIPYGRITTYGAIANFLGTKNSSRMVGWALNKCFSLGYNIPAHRVVNRKGLLTGKKYFGGSKVMEQLLENEGVKIQNNKVIDFERLFWDPIALIKNDS